MKSKTRTSIKKTTGRLKIMRRDTAALLKKPGLFLPSKPKDSGDDPLGWLTDHADLRGWHLLREQRYANAASIVASIVALDADYTAKQVHDGAAIAPEKHTAFKASLDELIPQLELAVNEFNIAERMFDTLILAEFNVPKGNITGVRKGFELVSRTDNARGDRRNPMDGLTGLKNVRLVRGGQMLTLADILGMGMGGGHPLFNAMDMPGFPGSGVFSGGFPEMDESLFGFGSLLRFLGGMEPHHTNGERPTHSETLAPIGGG